MTMSGMGQRPCSRPSTFWTEGHWRMYGTAPPPGISEIPAPSGGRVSAGTGPASDRRQLWYAQTRPSEELAGSSPALSFTLHADQLFLAESRRALVCQADQPAHPARQFL